MSYTGRAVVIGEYAGADCTISLRFDEQVDVLKKSDKWWYVCNDKGAKGYFPSICLRELASSELPALPAGWHRTNSSDNRVYYYNDTTGHSQWEYPTEARPPPPPPPIKYIALESAPTACRNSPTTPVPALYPSAHEGEEAGATSAERQDIGSPVAEISVDVGNFHTPPPPLLPLRPSHTPHSSLSEYPPPVTPVGHYHAPHSYASAGTHTLEDMDEGDETAIARAALLSEDEGAHATSPHALADTHHLPEDLKSAIERFSIQGFADEHFNAHKRWTLFRGRQKMKPEEVLSFSKSGIKQSLTRLSKATEGFAVKLNPRIIALAENDKKRWGSSATYTEAFCDIVNAVANHARTDHFIVDEAFCQAIKVCTNNPAIASTERGWALLYAFMICFAPSRELAKYLFKQSRLARRSPNAIGGFAICTNKLALLQLQNSPMLPHKIRADSLEMGKHIDPVMSFHIPEKLYGCPVECVMLWERVQMIGDSIAEDLRCSTISLIGRETLTADNKVDIADQLPALYEVLEATEPPGILVLLCDAVINLNAANKRGIFREAANVDTVRHFLSKLEAGELDCLLYASDGEGDSATAGADVVSDVLVACDLLKMWFRRLPQPIVPYACYAQCVRAGQRGDAALAQEVLDTMPPLYKATLAYLCSFIKYISSFSTVTLMEVSNLCLVFSPNVIKNPSNDLSVIAMNSDNEKRCLQLFVSLFSVDEAAGWRK